MISTMLSPALRQTRNRCTAKCGASPSHSIKCFSSATRVYIQQITLISSVEQSLMCRLPSRCCAPSHTARGCLNNSNIGRSYWTVSEWSKPVRTQQDLVERIDRLANHIIATNWADYIQFVHNRQFWQAEYDIIEASADEYMKDNAVVDKMKKLRELMDAMTVVEDVRDHTNELLDYLSRCGGMAGTGAYKQQPIDNLNDHAQLLNEKYESLKKTYPSYLPQIEAAVGGGLALLRSKHKYEWKSAQDYNF